MKWTDYEFPAWVVPQIQEKILAANPDFELWSENAYKLGVFAVGDLAGFRQVTDDKYVSGFFIYYKDNLGFICDKHTYWHEVYLEKKRVIRPQMLKYQLFTRTSKAKLAAILANLIKLNGKFLQSIEFIDSAQLLIEIPIGTKTLFETNTATKLETITKVSINANYYP